MVRSECVWRVRCGIRLLCGVAAFALFSAGSPASAGWFGKKEGAPEAGDAKERVLSEERGAAFVALVSQKRVIDEDRFVIERLLNEKRRELATFNDTLRDRYGIDPAAQYAFDASENRIYLLSKPSEEAPEGGRTLHREITPEQGKDFVRHVSAKSITASQIRALALLAREKQLERASANEALKGQFGIDPEVDYRYDPQTRTIYRKQ